MCLYIDNHLRTLLTIALDTPRYLTKSVLTLMLFVPIRANHRSANSKACLMILSRDIWAFLRLRETGFREKITD